MYRNMTKQKVASKPQPPTQIQKSNPQNPPNYQNMGYNWGHENPKNILLYIDNSNIFEESRKHSARLKGYLSGIIDVALRIDVGKLISKAVGGRELLFGKLYGSEPPALDTVWEAIRRKHAQVKTFECSKWTLKEKEIDASITADAVEDIVMQKDLAWDDRTLILFSGDRDLMSENLVNCYFVSRTQSNSIGLQQLIQTIFGKFGRPFKGANNFFSRLKFSALVGLFYVNVGPFFH